MRSHRGSKPPRLSNGAVIFFVLVLFVGGNAAFSVLTADTASAVSSTWNITTVAGGGTEGESDGVSAISAGLQDPASVTVDSSGNLIISDSSDNVIRVEAESPRNPGYILSCGSCWSNGALYTIAGDGTAGRPTGGNPALSVALSDPYQVAVDAIGNLVFSSNSNQIMLIAVSEQNPGYILGGCSGGCPAAPNWTVGDIYVVAGSGEIGFSPGNVPALSADLRGPLGVAFDSKGNLLFADADDNVVQVVAMENSKPLYGISASNWVVGNIYNVVGGCGNCSSELAFPSEVTTDADGNLLIADQHHGIIRLLAESQGNPGYTQICSTCWADGDLYTIAGGGTGGDSDGVPAIDAQLHSPDTLAVDANGNVVFSQFQSYVVQVVAMQSGSFYGQTMSAGDIYTVAGDGSAGYSGDGMVATAAELGPEGLAVEANGDLAIADTLNNRIRLIGPSMPSASISIVKTANVTGFSGAGVHITYSYQVTNTGNLTLDSVGVTDDLVSVTCPSTTLVPAASETCTATYTTTSTDVQNGGITNFASATGTPFGGPSVTASTELTIPSTSIPPSHIVAIEGTPQSTPVNTQFATDLEVQVTDAAGAGVSGVAVTFTAPPSGPTGTFANGSPGGSTIDVVTSDVSGMATSDPFSADSTHGSFLVQATAGAAVSTNVSATFALSNTETGSQPCSLTGNQDCIQASSNPYTGTAIQGGGFNTDGSGTCAQSDPDDTQQLYDLLNSIPDPTNASTQLTTGKITAGNAYITSDSELTTADVGEGVVDADGYVPVAGVGPTYSAPTYIGDVLGSGGNTKYVLLNNPDNNAGAGDANFVTPQNLTGSATEGLTLVPVLPQGTASAPLQVQFTSGECYRVNGTVLIRGLTNVIMDGNGATFYQGATQTTVPGCAAGGCFEPQSELSNEVTPPSVTPYCSDSTVGTSASRALSDTTGAFATNTEDVMWWTEGGCNLEFENMTIVGTRPTLDSGAGQTASYQPDVTFTSGTSTVLDPSISKYDAGKPLSGIQGSELSGSQAQAYVGTVTPGLSFTMIDANGNALTATASSSPGADDAVNIIIPSLKALEQDSAFEVAGTQKELITGNSVQDVYGDCVTVFGLQEGDVPVNTPSFDITVADNNCIAPGRDGVAIAYGQGVTVGGTTDAGCPWTPPSGAPDPAMGNCFQDTAANGIDLESDSGSSPGENANPGGESNISVENNNFTHTNLFHLSNELVSGDTAAQINQLSFDDNTVDQLAGELHPVCTDTSSVTNCQNTTLPGQNFTIEGNSAAQAAGWTNQGDWTTYGEVSGLAALNATLLCDDTTGTPDSDKYNTCESNTSYPNGVAPGSNNLPPGAKNAPWDFVYTGAYPAGNVNGSAVNGPEGGLFTVQDNELDGNNAPFATGGITHYATAPIEADYGESSNDAACNNVSYSESAAYTVHSFVTPPVGVTSTPVNKDKNPTSPYLGVTPGTCAGAAPVPATVAEIPNLPGIVLPDPPRQMVDHGLPRSPTRQTSAPSSRVRSEPDAATGAPMTADRLATAGPASDPATPTVDCSGVTGSLTFDPPLSSASKASEMALVHVALSGCHGSGGAPSPTTGNGVTNLFLPTNNCQALLTALSRPTSLAVSWAPSSIGPSDVTFSGETPSTSSDLSFNLGSSASPLHATLKTSVSLSAFESQCAAGVPTLSVSGGSVGTAIDAPSAAAPSSPTAATAFAGNGKATLAWFAPTDTGGSPITGYTITPYLSGTALAPVIVGNVVQTKIKHLTNGDSYTFTVAAINAVGTGPASSLSNAVTPSTLPGAPIGAAAVGGHGSATVSFTPPASNGGNAITGYTVEATDTTTRDNGGQVASGSSSPITVTGLTNGDTYTFTVQATNATGSGSPSVASNAVVPSGAPGAPTGATATANSTAATVSFSPPASNGGSAITGYTVTAADTTNAANGGQMASGGTSPITVTGLTNGDTYTFSVTATNAIGTGPPSGPSTGVVPEPQTLSVTQSGGDTGNCLTSSCATISYAVSQAFPDDTIDVGPGTFPDNVDIPGTLTNLTINGSASGTTVDGNAAGYVFNIEGGASATLNDLTITNGNGAPTNSCGGVCAQYDSGITLTNDTITGNTNGAVSNTGIATLTDDTLSGNDSGFANFETAALTNVTISGNTLTGAGNGAGVFNAGFLTLIGSTIANNSAGGEGGGIYNYHQITLAGTIIGNNMSGSGGVCATTGAGAFVDDGYNLSYDNSCGLSTANNSLINTDPLLGPLQANGGQTETMAPNSDSPVLNQIPDPTTTVAGIALCPGADQRGVARPQGTGCDMGSVELGS